MSLNRKRPHELSSGYYSAKMCVGQPSHPIPAIPESTVPHILNLVHRRTRHPNPVLPPPSALPSSRLPLLVALFRLSHALPLHSSVSRFLAATIPQRRPLSSIPSPTSPLLPPTTSPIPPTLLLVPLPAVQFCFDYNPSCSDYTAAQSVSTR